MYRRWVVVEKEDGDNWVVVMCYHIDAILVSVTITARS